LLIPAEFSRPLALDSVPPSGTRIRLEASVDECRALAKRFDLVSLDRLEGVIDIAPVDLTHTVHVSGRVFAHVVQSCVVTFEPVAARIEADFDRLFSSDEPVETDAEVEIDIEAETPEPMVGDQLDLGEILAEELSLALDPYPRAADADQRLAEFSGDEPGAKGPFGALARLRSH
jgi:uncharacterized metal-binding protein YceD (DUF177 family)